MFYFNIVFRARFRLYIFFQKTVELSVAHSFHHFNLVLRYNIKIQGSDLKINIVQVSCHMLRKSQCPTLIYIVFTWDTWEPMALWAALQAMHITTPRLRLSHSGPGASQSTHTVFPSSGSSTLVTSPACSVPWSHNFEI